MAYYYDVNRGILIDKDNTNVKIRVYPPSNGKYRRRDYTYAFIDSKEVVNNPIEPPMNPLVFYDRLVTDGKAYILTNYYSSADTTKSVRVVGCIPKDVISGTTWYVLGSQSGSSTSSPRTSLYVGMLYSRVGYYAKLNNSINPSIYRAGTFVGEFDLKAHIDNDDLQYCSVEDSTGTYKSSGYSGRTGTHNIPLAIFGNNYMGTEIQNLMPTGSYINKIEIIDDAQGKLIFFPCTFMGEAGLYDIINGVFYGNANSEGKFEVEGEGSVIPNMEGKATFGVISSDACFDTDIRKEEIASVEIMAEFKGLNGHGWRESPMLFGTRRSGGYDNWDNCGFYPAVDDDNSPNWWYRGRKFKDNVLKYQLPINEPVIIRGGAEGFSVDSRKFNFSDYATEEYAYGLVFERGISIGRLGLDNPKPWWSPAFEGSIYYFKIFDEDGKLTHQLVAKQEEGNRAYLYDEITKKEYHSVGGAVQFESIR